MAVLESSGASSPQNARPPQELIRAFLEDAPRHIKSLRNALHARDWEQAKGLCETLQGASEAAHATRFRHVTDSLAQALIEESEDSAPHWCARLEHELEALRAACRTHTSFATSTEVTNRGGT